MDRVTAGGFSDALEKADIYNDLYDDFRMPVQKPIVKEKKVYPNDPCPCGSGKNIKNVVENSNGDFNMQRQYIFTKTDSIRKIQEKKQKTRNQQNFYMIWEI